MGMGINEVGTFAYTDWGNEVGRDYVNNLSKNANLSTNKYGLKSIFNKQQRTAWANDIKTNVSNLKNYGQNTSFNGEINKIKSSYNTVHTPEYIAVRAKEKAAAKAAKLAANGGKVGWFSKCLKGIKSAFKAIPGMKTVAKFAKKVPILGTALMVLSEVPKIVQSFSEHGFIEGMKQIGRSAVNLAGDFLAFNVGTILATVACGVFGIATGGLGFLLIAGIAGAGLCSLTRKVTEPVANGVFGKSKVEEKEKTAEKMQKQMQPQAQQPQQTVSPFSYTPAGEQSIKQQAIKDYLALNNGYNVKAEDIMNPNYNPYITEAFNYQG